MKKIVMLAQLFFLSHLVASADDGDYAVSKIADSLLKNADAVLRLEELKFEIINTGKAVFTNHYVITILNENGDHWAEFSDYYDKDRKIESVEGFLYDASGKALKKMKEKNMEDLSGSSESNLIDDNRIRRHNFYYKVYPYTIEYTEEVEYRSTLFFPPWMPIGGDRLSVEQSSISIICPSDYQFRFKAFNYTGDPVIMQQKNNRVSTWAVKNIAAIERESYSPPWHELTTMVIFGPTDFQIGDYKGNMASWQDFGKFVYSLKSGRDVLPDNVKQKVHELTAAAGDSKRKIAALYEYLQKNTRYVSVQLGIGGWQPFDAAYVATKAYGDCKALSNYMYSLLKEAGIPSYYTLARAGSNKEYITADFPSQQFNHVILCVPLPKDTVWLECTSQTVAPGYLGDFTSDRDVLLVDENGGALVHTPRYGCNENLELRHTHASVDETGYLEASVKTKYMAEQQDRLHGIINGLSKDKLMKFLKEDIELATYDVEKFEYKEERNTIPTIHETLDLVASNYAIVSGKRFFIQPNIITRTNLKLKPDENRKYDIVLNTAFKDIDTTEIKIPAGYSSEYVPQDVSIDSKFGKYSASVKLSGDKIIYYRSYEHYSGRFPAKEYADLVKFHETIYKADRNKVVLVKDK